MAGNGVPVLQLDFDDEKIKRLNEIADKFRSALSIGPGGFRVPGGTADNPSTSPPSQATTVRQRDDNGRFIPGQTPAAVPVDPAQQQLKPGFFGRMFTRQYSPAKNETDKFFNDFNKQGKQTKKTFDEIDKSLKGTTSSLEKLFKNTVTWGARVLALGAGGTFGYNYMASKVAEQYAGAQGLGISTGQQQAARNVYGGRITGADNILQSLANAQNDPSNPMYAAMVNMGIDPKKGAAQNLPQFLSGVSKILQQYKGTGVSQQALKGHGLDGVIDVATANQIIANSDRLPQLNQQFGEQSQRLDAAMGAGTSESYQNLSAKFGENADRIGNTFLNALSKLNGPIGKFSDSITGSIEKFLTGGNFDFLLKKVGDALDTFSGWLSGPTFQKDLDDFAKNVKEIASSIGSAVSWIKGVLPSEASGESPGGEASSWLPAAGALAGTKIGRLLGIGGMAGAGWGAYGAYLYSDRENISDSAKSSVSFTKRNIGDFARLLGINTDYGRDKNTVMGANVQADIPGGGNVPDRNNNPGNIRPVGGKGFNTYASEAEGWGAMSNQLMRYYTGKTTGTPLRTIKDIVSTWAPAADKNKPSEYAAQVAKWMGVSETEILDLTKPDTMASLMHSMARKEGFTNWSSQLADQAAGATNVTVSIDQKPGSDIAAQVKGITLARR
ncbi:hypothetical protein [Enterobacter asburiae]|uniref:hypothetical protein n=1 Tax=Enterobacter asburiae TaxID=61645 RepID=UPI00210EED36|nr:hypothetical protein [Enterobacter asburiae]MCQ4369986.1 hypothetical protein [Enterobacter asburiae]HDC4619823.1 hypothetical protein [Enterobacter asburiae]